MSTQTNPLPGLADAITAVEQADTSYQAAQNQTALDQNAAVAAQQKADAAAKVVTDDQTLQTSAVAAEIAALHTLDTVIQVRIAALTSSQPPAANPTPTPPPPATVS